MRRRKLSTAEKPADLQLDDKDPSNHVREQKSTELSLTLGEKQ